MRLVGLTGGFSSGKSTVSNLFKAVDVVKKGTGGWKRVVAPFGKVILLDNGENRVFSDPEQRRLLNRRDRNILKRILGNCTGSCFEGTKVIVLDFPLLFKAKMDKWTNPIVVVWVDPEIQFQPLIARDGISKEQAMNRIKTQTSLDWKG